MTGAAVRAILERAIGYAVAVLVASFVLAALLSDVDAERFATTAYLAAVAIALALAVRTILPAREMRIAKSLPPFPAILAYSATTIVLVGIGAAFVADPGAEATIFTGFALLIALLGFIRSGAAARVFGWLVRGGVLSGTINCAALLLVVAIAGAAWATPENAEAPAKLAYAAGLALLAALTVSQFAATRFGRDLRAAAARTGALLVSPASAAVFATAARYSAATFVVSVLLALVSSEPTAERFATVAYIAALFAAGTAVMTWRLRAYLRELARPSDTPAAARFGIVALVLSLAGAALAGRTSGEILLSAFCVAALVMGIAVRARAIDLPRVLTELSARGATALDRLSAAFARNEALTTIVRYCALIAVVALAVTAFVPQAFAGRAVWVAYVAAIVAALALGVQRFLPSA